MKIQLKRSNVLDGSDAKKPTAEQMEYGELAVNYNNTDPALFIKASNDSIVRITGTGSAGSFSGDYNDLDNKPTIGNGSININAGNGLSVSGDNATANQTGTTTRTLTAVAADNSLSVTASGISVNDANLTPSWNNITDKPSNVTGGALSSGSYLTGGPYDGSAAKTFNVDATTAATGSKVVARDSNSDIFVRYCMGTYMNMTHARATRNSDSTFYSSTDDYIRKNDAAGMRSSLNVPTRTGGNASGTWSINITGSAGSASSATNATNATNFNVLADNSTNSTHYVIFTGGTSGNQRPNSDSTLTYNPSSNTLNAGTFNSTSDVTLKTDVTSIDGALSRLCNIEGVGFAWKNTGVRTYGVIAQDVEKEFPELVQTEEFKSVNYNGLVGVLIEAIKELKAEVEELKKG